MYKKVNFFLSEINFLTYYHINSGLQIIPNVLQIVYKLFWIYIHYVNVHLVCYLVTVFMCNFHLVRYCKCAILMHEFTNQLFY